MLLSKGRLGQRNQMASLTKKYDTTAFMYTEYPHKNFWSRDMGEPHFKSAIESFASDGRDTPIMLYLHFPYCEQLCWFCTCHMTITKDRARIVRYLDYLYREIEMFRRYFDEKAIWLNFREVHLGGGSPTYLTRPEFGEMVDRLATIVDFTTLDECALEVDPRQVDESMMHFYHEKGISRISFGVQDIDLDVQKAINRVQPPELIEKLLTPEVRSLFKEGVNFDLLCGLPLQTPESIRATCERVVEMSPDRICLNYMHYSPKFAPHQNIMMDGREGRPDRLPDFYERKVIFLEALDALTDAGYVRMGYDHFAKPSDSVARARESENMHWNALGVTPGRVVDVLGVGIYSISTLGDLYFQNFHELPDYEEAIDAKRFPVLRGHKLSFDDIVRRDVIKRLRSYFRVEFAPVEERYGIDFRAYFRKEIESLGNFIEDGMVELGTGEIVIGELGHQFANLVCRTFDAYYEGGQLAADLGELSRAADVVPGISTQVKEAMQKPDAMMRSPR